jgi:hypothetical protein
VHSSQRYHTSSLEVFCMFLFGPRHCPSGFLSVLHGFGEGKAKKLYRMLVTGRTSNENPCSGDADGNTILSCKMISPVLGGKGDQQLANVSLIWSLPARPCWTLARNF